MAAQEASLPRLCGLESGNSKTLRNKRVMSQPQATTPDGCGVAAQEASLQRRFCLESGDSETLRVQPVRRVIHLSTFSKATHILY